MADPIYKILPARDWEAARDRGDPVPRAPVDEADGFMHLSSRHQVRGTADKHFAGTGGLVLLAVDPTGLPEGSLRWEVSRGGERFPHVYGAVPASAVISAVPLPWTVDGFVYPAGF